MKQIDGGVIAGIVFSLLMVAMVIAGGFGWVMNLMKVVSMTEISPVFIVRCIGVVIAPLGALMGYLP